MTNRAEEALRYLGAGRAADGSAAAELRIAVQRMLEQLDHVITPNRLYRLFTLCHDPDGSVLLMDSADQAVLTLTGKLAQIMLHDCHQAALMLSTLGVTFDSLLRTQQARSMADAAILNACGNVLVEEACDQTERELAAQMPDLYLTDRFSPGYGDLPLTLQPTLLRALDANRLAGVYATESCLMNPTKTVTAIVGLSHRPQQAKIRGCAYCSLKETCTIRKDGKRCDSL
ncbi:MAG: methionine synthase [Clostridiales bacterium]|nr:methionine synthase [Clostridiales bacterium]